MPRAFTFYTFYTQKFGSIHLVIGQRTADSGQADERTDSKKERETEATFYPTDTNCKADLHNAIGIEAKKEA